MRRCALGLLLLACNSRAPSTEPTAVAGPGPGPSAQAPTPSPSARTPEALPSASARASSPDAGDDAITRLVTRLRSQRLWTNGHFPTLDLPRSATRAEVVAKVFTQVSFNPGPVKTHRIVEARSVVIGDEAAPYDAVLVDTEQGRKIVLIRFEAESTGWWSRVFDAGAP